MGKQKNSLLLKIVDPARLATLRKFFKKLVSKPWRELGPLLRRPVLIIDFYLPKNQQGEGLVLDSVSRWQKSMHAN